MPVPSINNMLPSAAKSVLVSTVDAFQGGEREIIVLSCVRTNTQSGFVDSTRRVNVAITRARRYCTVAMPREGRPHSANLSGDTECLFTYNTH